ncbi:MAG: nucleoside hydrolase [Woeseiaceae bacterium]
MKKVIFDTDIGIDDAMALLFLHYSPNVDLQAIVSGFGNANIETTTRNALYIKERFGIAAPVFFGASGPSGERLGEGYPDFVHGSNGLGDIQLEEPSIQHESQPGAEAIVDIVARNPHEISIVAVGRLTNLAKAIDLCPELPSLVREVVIMGGAFGNKGHSGNVSPVAEANIAGDPQAADKVFTAGWPIAIAGLDVTHETTLDDQFFDSVRSRAGKAGEFIYQISRFYLDFHADISGKRECPMHDSSAVAYLLNPSLYKTRDAAVRVVTKGISIGQTIAGDPAADYATDAWQDKPACQVCVDVDAAEVLDLYRETLALARDDA